MKKQEHKQTNKLLNNKELFVVIGGVSTDSTNDNKIRKTKLLQYIVSGIGVVAIVGVVIAGVVYGINKYANRNIIELGPPDDKQTETNRAVFYGPNSLPQTFSEKEKTELRKKIVDSNRQQSPVITGRDDVYIVNNLDGFMRAIEEQTRMNKQVTLGFECTPYSQAIYRADDEKDMAVAPKFQKIFEAKTGPIPNDWWCVDIFQGTFDILAPKDVVEAALNDLKKAGYFIENIHLGDGRSNALGNTASQFATYIHIHNYTIQPKQ